MTNFIELLKGKKTFITAIAIAALGVLQGLDIFIAPDWLWPILGALGLGFVRIGVKQVADSVNSPTE